MKTNKNRREIINRRVLNGKIAALYEQISDPVQRRTALVALLKDNLQKGREVIEKNFMNGAPGPEVAAASSYLIDQVITVTFEYVDQRIFPSVNPTAADRLALIAVGGYGRGEMAPFSDVDVSFLHPWKLTPRAEQVVEYLLYIFFFPFNYDLNLKKLAINFGNIKVIEKGQLFSNYEEIEVAEYMRGEKVDLTIDLNIGNKSFTAYTMDLTKKYIEINADYRS